MELAFKKNSTLWFLPFAVLFILQTAPLILEDSPINDGLMELTNGYFYWQGDVITHHRHPPFTTMLQALPLRFMGLRDDLPLAEWEPSYRSHLFFFQMNPDRFEAMLDAGRWVDLIIGLAIGWILFLNTRSSQVGFLTTMVLWAFHPTFLAYSGVVLADIPVTFFFMVSVLAFRNHLEKPGIFWSWVAGSLAALAACSKFSALALIPLFGILEAWDLYKDPEKKMKSRLKDWGWGTLGFLGWIALIYIPGTLFLPDHRSPFFYFRTGLFDMVHYSNFHHPVYFLATLSRNNHLAYFPTVFLLKNTLPFLILLFGSLLWASHRRSPYPAWMVVTPFFFFLCILPVQNLGVRYLLPCFPFFILMIAKTIQEVWAWGWNERTRFVRIALGGLLIWHAGSTLAQEPHLIGYFNDLIPVREKVYFLADCDLDMGQDVKRLARFGEKEGWRGVKLAQFGGIDPKHYGLDWEPWTQKDLEGPQPGHVYVVNLALVQIGPDFFPDLLPIAKSWVVTRTPTGKIGDSFLYFVIPGEARPDHSKPLNSARVP